MPAKTRKPGSAFRFTIRIKLLLVTTIIIGVSLSIMILMATRFFRDHSETLIQEYNLSLASLIGARVESDLNDLASRSRLMAGLLEEPALSEERVGRYAEIFFHENKHCIFLGVAVRDSSATANRPDGPAIRLRHALANRDYDPRGAHPSELLETDAAGFAQSFAGATLVRNVTDATGAPILAVSMPLHSPHADQTGANADRGGEGAVLIALIQSGPLLETFRQNGQTALFDIFMVDQSGSLIAHSVPEKLKCAAET
ncbi:MAG: hypothetical protein RIF32_19520, partial [Leptospirales bacterium]